MKHLLLLLALLAAPWARPARAAAGVPPRPVPFTFVTDQAKLLAPAEAKKLDNGLRHYASKTGNQVVVVTVPSLDGTDIADYGRQLGTAWGIGQRDKNNGVIVLLAGKEHKLTIQAGSGLRSAITPELTQRVISQEMTPAFKSGDYFGGLRQGLNTLMAAADPNATQAAKTTTTPASTSAATGASLASANVADPAGVQQTEAPAATSTGGFGLGSLLIGAVVLLGGIWLVRKLFNRNNNAAEASQAPNFMGNRPAGNTPNFGAPNAGPGYQQPGYGAPVSGGGSGIGGMLATGAAAAAGAYLGNRMASGHDSGASMPHNFDSSGTAAGAGTAGAGTGAAGDYFASRGNEGAGTGAEPDYFSDANTADSSGGDYFSNDSSYDDTSSGDTGGGGFDSSDDSQGSW